MEKKNDEVHSKTGLQDNSHMGRRLEDALKEHEELSRLLADQSIMGMHIIQDGLIKYVNLATAKITGYSIEEMMNWEPEGYRILLHPEELPFVMEQARKKQTGSPDIVVNYTWRIITKSGETRWVESFSKTTLFKGSPADFVMIIDITDRKHAWLQKEAAIEKLRQSEQRYRKLADDYQAIVENTSEGIYRSIPEGRYLMANHAFVKMLGYDSPEELLCSVTNISNQIYVDGERRKESIRRILESGHGDFEIQFKRKDGSVGWLANSVRVVRNERGEIKYYEGVTKDITERKQMEFQREDALDALRNSHGHLDDIIDFLPDATFVVDCDGKVSTWNRTMEHMSGIPKANMIGRGNYEYAIPFYGQRRPILINLALLPDNVFENNHYENVYRRGDTLYAEAYVPQTYGGKGAFMWGTASRLRDASGKIIGAIESIRDITERKQAEESLFKSERKFASLFKLNPNPMTITDMVTEKIIDVNQSLIQWSGYSREEVIGVSAQDLHLWVNPADREKIIETLAAAEEVNGAEVMMRKKNGHVRNMLLSLRFIEMEQKRYLLTLGHDITDRKQAEEEIRRTQDQMRAFAARLQRVREEERTRIAREIHDEMGGALTGIKIDFSLLKKAAAGIKEKSLKDHLSNQIQNTTKLIDKTIKTVRKISAELRPGILDDLGILAALEWQLKDFQKRTGIGCKWISSLNKINLKGQEATALFRIFQETLVNVTRHAGATEVRVRLRKGANTYLLEVDDNGKGITKKNIDDKRSLGLLGMRERALAVGGRIDIEGHPGKGTRVTVEVPIK